MWLCSRSLSRSLSVCGSAQFKWHMYRLPNINCFSSSEWMNFWWIAHLKIELHIHPNCNSVITYIVTFSIVNKLQLQTQNPKHYKTLTILCVTCYFFKKNILTMLHLWNKRFGGAGTRTHTTQMNREVHSVVFFSLLICVWIKKHRMLFELWFKWNLSTPFLLCRKIHTNPCSIFAFRWP